MASGVSLSDLIMLPGRYQQLQNTNKLLGKQTEYYGAAVPEIEARTTGFNLANTEAQNRITEEQHQQDLAHANQAILVGQQMGLDSPEFADALKNSRIAQEHGVAGYTNLMGADAQHWGVPEGTWMALGKDGKPIMEHTISYDANGRVAPTSPGEGPDTGAAAAAPANPRPLFVTPETRTNLIRYHEAKGAPEKLGGYETSNVPGVPNRDITVPAERAQADYWRFLNGQLRWSESQARAAQADPYLTQIGNIASRVFADPMGKGLTPDGQTIVMDAISARQDVAKRNPKAGPAELGQIALKEAWQHHQQRASLPGQDPMAQFANALGAGDQPAPFQIPGAAGQPPVNAAGFQGGAPTDVPGPPQGEAGGAPAPAGNLWEDINARRQQEQQQEQQGARSAQAAKAKRIGGLQQRAYQLLLNEAARIQQQFPDWQREQVLESALAAVRAEMPSEGAYSMDLWPQIEAYLRQTASSQASAATPAPQSARGGVVATGTHVPPEVRGTSATRAPGAARGGVAKVKMEKTMREWKEGTLHSGSKSGPIVTSQKQAVVIGLNQGRRAQRGFGMGVR